MNESELNQKLTQFQAFCRGYLIRKYLSLVRTQFEDIVREIDGGLDNLHWEESIIPKPHFTDTESLLLQYGRFKNQSYDDQFEDSAREQMTDNMYGETPVPSSEVLVPEKDEVFETGNRDKSTPLDEDRTIGPNCMGESTTLWSVVNPDVTHSSFLQKGDNLHFAFKDTEHTPESLRQQRSTLTMELLWIQQAISSRKKYLTLIQRMDASH
ncbi:IQ domain-containing protein C [Paramisgurnus dabryanus]|uniref:IQ domain-containing protein C n=1 Tax=Paramisgurnus dabryanus TaxID=90735 RepID=UPI0031F36B02